MPILGRTTRECVEQFRNVLAKLLVQVLHKTRTVRAIQVGDRFLIGILDEYGEATPVKLARAPGQPDLYLQLWQTVEIVDEVGGRGKRAFRLRTLEYNYHLSADPAGEPLLRWEYVKRPKDNARYSRHHLQGTVVDESSHLDFTKMHIPTAYILLEDVLRFVIYDLKHRPPCGDKWHGVLEESREHFFEELSSRPQSYTTHGT